MRSVTVAKGAAILVGLLVTVAAAYLLFPSQAKNQYTDVAGSSISKPPSSSSAGGPTSSSTSSAPDQPFSTTSPTRATDADVAGPSASSGGSASTNPSVGATTPSPDKQPANGGNGGGTGGGKDKNPPDTSGKTFSISGDVSGLFPGASRPLVLTFTNSNNFAIKITSMEVAAATSDKGGCGASNLITPSFRDDPRSMTDDIIVPAKKTASHTFQVRMTASPANACQGATWALSYTGQAERA